MSTLLLGTDRHADRVLEVVGNSLGQASNDVVARSWSRCLDQYRLRPEDRHVPLILEGVALQARCARQADVIECARYEMTTLYQQLADAESAVHARPTDPAAYAARLAKSDIPRPIRART